MVGGWGVGELISLFLDFTASHGMNRKHPGIPNRIQVDLAIWNSNRKASRLVYRACFFPENVVTSLFTRNTFFNLQLLCGRGLCYV